MHFITLLLIGYIVGLLLLIYFRSRYKDDVESFIHEKMHERSQRELIETQVEMNAQLKSFLPKEIYLRMEELLSRKKTLKW